MLLVCLPSKTEVWPKGASLPCPVPTTLQELNPCMWNEWTNILPFLERLSKHNEQNRKLLKIS